MATLIPPSVVFIYGRPRVSIGQCTWLVLMPVWSYCLYIVVRCWISPELAPPAPPEERNLPLADKLKLLGELGIPILVALMVLGSLYLGIATPTEAGDRERPAVLGDHAIEETTKVTVMLYWLFFGSSALIGVYTLAGGTKLISGYDDVTAARADVHHDHVPDHLDHPGLFQFDWIGILFLTARSSCRSPKSSLGPGLARGPVLPQYADLLHLAAVRARCLYLGVTPPGITLGRMFGSIWPYLIIQVIVLGLVIAFPQIALWLPSTMAR